MWLYSISKFFSNPYRDDLLVKIAFISSVIINLITWVALYFKIHPFAYLSESGQVYLHYNLYFGIDKIDEWYKVFIIPLLGLIFIIFNNLLGYFFYIKEKLISYILVISQTALQIILFAAAIFVILLNI